MNTGESDMDVIGERTEYVFGRSVQAGGSGSPAPPTAVGVYHGIRASLFHAFGSTDLKGRIVIVQGAGGVGSPLANLLASAGATVLVADVDPGRANAVAARVGGAALPTDQLFEVDCDVYAPCAVGGILSLETVPRLRCRIVAGSANNQLAAPEAAGLLRERGILYAPDYAINAGGASRSSASSSSAGAAPKWTRRWPESARRYGRSTSAPTRWVSRRRPPPMHSPRSG